LRWLSHLELLRAMERLIRRSGLPYATTHGFNAHMRFAPGPALPVGTSGARELFDVWLTEYLPPAKALACLGLAAADQIPIHEVCYVPTQLRGLQSTHNLESYELRLLSPDRDLAALQAALDELLDRETLTLVRREKSKDYQTAMLIATTPLLKVDATDGSLRLSLTLRSSEQGAARPESLADLILGEQGSVLEVQRLSVSRDGEGS